MGFVFQGNKEAVTKFLPVLKKWCNNVKVHVYPCIFDGSQFSNITGMGSVNPKEIRVKHKSCAMVKYGEFLQPLND